MPGPTRARSAKPADRAEHGDARLFPRASRRRGDQHRRHDRAGGRRRPPRGARRRDRRRPRRGARRSWAGRKPRRPTTCRDRGVGRVLGVARVVWLGYTDSGMTGWEQNEHPGSFHRADPDEAGARLAAVLREESADVLTIYDWHGNYGHPDHIAVHRVGLVAGRSVAGGARARSDHEPRRVRAPDRGGPSRRVQVGNPDGEQDDLDVEFDPMAPADDGNPMGMPEAELTLSVDVSAYLDVKRAAIAVSSQPDRGHVVLPADARRRVRPVVRHRVVHRARRPATRAQRLALPRALTDRRPHGCRGW
jgi:LmbE family N-acetylglucosaminyl deacetylase